MSANTKVGWEGPYAGKKLTARHRQMILARERILKWGRFSTTIVQGSFNYGVAASAGTHDGGDCADYTTNEGSLKEKFGRILGEAYFKRTRAQGFSMDHGHGVLDYSSSAAPIAKNQLVSYHGRRNGLRGNGPDTGYRMLVFPKFIYNGYVGYVRAKKATGAYEQPTSKSKLITSVKTGQITYVVAEVEVSGKRWFVTLTGKCILASNFDKIPQDYKVTAIKQWYKVSKAPAHGRIAPGLSATDKGKSFHRPLGYKIYAVGKASVKDGVFVVTSHGTWYKESSLTKFTPEPASSGGGTTAPTPPKPAPTPTPAPAVPTLGSLVLATRNVIRWRMGDSERKSAVKNWKAGSKYETRANQIAKDALNAKADVLFTQEQGQYKDGELIADKMGDDYVSYLRGDNAGDITQANIYNKKTLPIADQGRIDVDSGTSHNRFTWTKHTEPKTKTPIYFLNVHAWWKEAGKSTQGNVNDKTRYAQFDKALTRMKQIAGEKALIIVVGDYNSSLENPMDGPGRALVKHGFVDAENYAKKKTNGNHKSYIGGTRPDGISQIDRFGVPKSWIESGRLVIDEWEVQVSSTDSKTSDHRQVNLRITIKKQ